MARPKTRTPEQQREHNRVYAKAWRAANPEKCSEHVRTYRKKNADALKERARSRRLETKEQRAAMRRTTRYGLSPDLFESMWLQQNGQCLICKTDMARNHKLAQGHAVDHCHTTGKIRGILCRKCNIGIGYFNDRSELLRNAADYLDGACST